MSEAPVLAQSLVVTMANQFGIESDKFVSVVKRTVMPDNSSNEEMAAFLMVANEHGFNPFTREIYAFKGKSGAIVPVVGVDGWIKKINEKPDFEGMELAPGADEEGKYIDCTIHRRGRRPTTIREYLKECIRDTGPWKSHPNRMLRHKSIIQCARVAYGFAGIYDPDEAERFGENDSPIPTLVTRTQERQSALREKLAPKELNAAPAVIDVDPLPMSGEAEPRPPVEPESGVTDDQMKHERARLRGLARTMIEEMSTKNQKTYLAEHDMESIDDVEKWDIDQLIAALEA